MGHLIKHSKLTSRKVVKKNQKSNPIIHRARVLSIADVEANRSRAYTYLPL